MYPMQVCERQAGTRSMHTQYSYNSNVSILLVSLLSRVSGSLRTTPFHFLKKCFYTCLYTLGPKSSFQSLSRGPTELLIVSRSLKAVLIEVKCIC